MALKKQKLKFVVQMSGKEIQARGVCLYIMFIFLVESVSVA